MCEKTAGSHTRAVGKPGDMSDIRVAIDCPTLLEIKQLRKRQYQEIYPDMDLENDQLDQCAITLFTRNAAGEINSTARLSMDGPLGLPEDEHLKNYRKSGKRLMEWGRFIIVDGSTVLLKRYYEAIFALASCLGVDAVVMAMKPKDISLHQRLLGIKIIKQDMGVSYGGPYSLACVVWELNLTDASFFTWIQK